MTTIDFVCPACGREIIAATLNDIWYALGKPCCSRECQHRVVEAARGVTAQDWMREDEAHG